MWTGDYLGRGSPYGLGVDHADRPGARRRTGRHLALGVGHPRVLLRQRVLGLEEETDRVATLRGEELPVTLDVVGPARFKRLGERQALHAQPVESIHELRLLTGGLRAGVPGAHGHGFQGLAGVERSRHEA